MLFCMPVGRKGCADVETNLPSFFNTLGGGLFG
jgi:hypothetical protein